MVDRPLEPAYRDARQLRTGVAGAFPQNLAMSLDPHTAPRFNLGREANRLTVSDVLTPVKSITTKQQRCYGHYS